MTNTAKILNFGRGNFAGQERTVITPLPTKPSATKMPEN